MLGPFSASDITFMDEQEGIQERRIKEAIAVLLDLDATVVRAINVVFLDDEDDARFANACAPFYNRLTRYHWLVATNDAAASAVL